MHVAVDPLRVAVTSALSRIRFRVAVSSSVALAAHAIFTEVEIVELIVMVKLKTNLPANVLVDGSSSCGAICASG